MDRGIYITPEEQRFSRIFEEEKSKLEFGNRQVSYQIRKVEPHYLPIEGTQDKSKSGFAARMSDRTYQVVAPTKILTKSNGRMRRFSRHELYHIAAGHLDQGSYYKPLPKFLLNELQARLYQYFSIDLCSVSLKTR